MRPALIATGLALLAAVGAAAAPAPVATHDSSTFERGYAAYMDFRFDDARRLFESAAAEPKAGASAHAWLALAAFRIGRKEQAWHEAHVALALDSCCTPAYDALHRCLNPQFGEWEHSDEDSAWACVLRGVRCDSLDGDLWESVWIDALTRDPALAPRAIRGLAESGLYRTPPLANARWMLRDVPPRTTLLANGDADLFPMLVVQQTESLRGDVALVSLSLLNLPAYRRYVRDRLGVAMPYPGESLDTLSWLPDTSGGWIPPARALIAGWLHMRAAGRLDRPVAMAISVSPTEVPTTVQLGSGFWLLDSAFAAGGVDTAGIRRGVMRMRREDLTGAAVSPASRSPYLRDASWIGHNVATQISYYCDACRSVGEVRRADELRAWGLAFFKDLPGFASSRRFLETLPERWSKAATPTRR